MTESPEDDLQTVATVKSEFEAHAVIAVLKDAGIEAFAFGYVKQALPLDMKFMNVAELRQNVSDSVDLDWDEVDVGEREDNVPLSSQRKLPSAMRAAIVIGGVILLAALVRFLMAVLR